MTRRLVVVGLWVASLAAAFALARPEPSTAPSPSTPAAAPVVHRAAPAAELAPSRAIVVDEVRRAVRAELAAEAPPAAEEAPREVVDEAHAVVQGAIDAGRWSAESREQLRVRMASLPREELDAVLSTLFVALNDGRVRVETEGPLL